MSLENLRVQDIEESVLLNLMAAQVPEGKTLDYKRDLPGSSDGAKREFLADLCSFANAVGGKLIYGMVEEDGLPSKLLGLNDDSDQAILRLEAMARDGIRPPILGLEFVRVRLSNGNDAIVVGVPKSWNSPHQVVFQKDYRFYTRGSAGKQHMDVDELRRVVLQSQEIGERVRQFRASRLASILADDMPAKLATGARQILHFIPFGAYGAGTSVDLRDVASRRTRLTDVTNRGGSVRFNVDGLLTYSESNETNEAYAQFYRSGILEIVVQLKEWKPRGKVVLPSLAFEEDVFAQAKAALALLQSARVSLPIVAMLSFVGIKGWEMGVNDPYGRRGTRGGFDRDPLLIPEMVVETYDAEVQRLFKPIVDATWNAGGYPNSLYYDAQGNWIGERGAW
jgi:hypothetical protein